MAKVHDILSLAEFEAKEASGSLLDSMRYLDTASRLYRFPFSDTLLIHAQRPDAVACAELETWNEKMRRWVNHGAKGIALIDDTGQRRKLRYVFDISGTHMVRGGRMPYLWSSRRCGLDPMEYLEEADFAGITDFIQTYWRFRKSVGVHPADFLNTRINVSGFL